VRACVDPRAHLARRQTARHTRTVRTGAGIAAAAASEFSPGAMVLKLGSGAAASQSVVGARRSSPAVLRGMLYCMRRLDAGVVRSLCRPSCSRGIHAA
jgi:hypothetical protein